MNEWLYNILGLPGITVASIKNALKRRTTYSFTFHEKNQIIELEFFDLVDTKLVCNPKLKGNFYKIQIQLNSPGCQL